MAVNIKLVERLWLRGDLARSIAKQAGCSVPYVSQVVRKLGLPKRAGRKPGRAIPDCDKFRELWVNGIPTDVIAQIYGCTYPTVTRLAKEYGYPERSKAKRRQRVNGAIITPEPDQEPEVSIAGVAGELIASKGEYAKLAAIADRHGWTLTYAQQRYHRARSDNG